jgi:hypothetical protein
MNDKADAEKLAADYPGWVIENSCAGTSYWFAHQGETHLGSASAAGLRRLLARQPANARTLADVMDGIGEAGF